VVNNPVGRFIFVNLILLLVVFILYRRFKDRGRRLLGALALDRFLGGMLHLSAGRYPRAAKQFEKVVRMGRWLNLAEAVDVYPEILGDARILRGNVSCFRPVFEHVVELPFAQILPDEFPLAETHSRVAFVLPEQWPLW